jgi:uncharacterized protein (DUF433 family)
MLDTIDYHRYITTDPDILGGKPCIAGTRISVQLILEQLALGDEVKDILDQYPHITEEQVHAALAFVSARIHDGSRLGRYQVSESINSPGMVSHALATILPICYNR